MRKFDEIKVGDKAEFSKTISETDLYLYCGISGDFNPLHVNALYASKSIFKGRIVHGLLVASLISNVVGMKLPGPGSIYITQDLAFLRPAYVGDTITAIVEVLDLIPSKRRIIIRTSCKNQNDELVIDGQAKVLYDPDDDLAQAS
jgi:3-hydroxybutyryl-CoA dehydratase